MTMAAVLAVLVAADPRVSHLALCRKVCPPDASTPPPVVKSERGCCSKASHIPPRTPANDRDDRGCDCCYVLAGYRTERDARSTFASSTPLKVDVVAMIGTFLAFSIDPPPVSVASSTAPAATGAGSLPCLLCNHLRT